MDERLRQRKRILEFELREETDRQTVIDKCM